MTRVSDAELAEIMNRGGRQAKYKSRKTGKYDSNKEAKRAQILKYEEHSGIISDLIEQPVFELIPKQKGERAVKYVADFQYMRDGELIVEDVKSAVTKKLPVYIVKRKLLLWVHGIRVLET